MKRHTSCKEAFILGVGVSLWGDECFVRGGVSLWEGQILLGAVSLRMRRVYLGGGMSSREGMFHVEGGVFFCEGACPCGRAMSFN